ncbi:MAG: response regulator [Candidatus Marinimicrobia bacterium CG08_land_8_20_14_0_20_45_22]|nr:MAG: response regulator [Candidatus Marinimicrobia bacterium CG08_land_8_20_14_0_20_45_22]
MKKKILIIDDDIDLVEVLRLTLEKNGYEVFDAQDGTRGMGEILKIRPDLVILDVMMATWDEGFEVAHDIRANPEIAGIPIVMLTAVSQQMGIQFEKDSDTLPVDEFIEKPVMPNRLVEIIKKCLTK